MSLKISRLNAEQPAIGKLVRELRQAMKLSQEKFADELGMTFPTINRWENGRATPSPLALKQIDSLLEQLGDRGEALRVKYFPGRKSQL
jgi:transcriptional regulator with XRE-family HTH domain